MRTYDESKDVAGVVWPGCWYLVDSVPLQPGVIMDVAEWKRRLGGQRITYCDVHGRGLVSSPEMKNNESENQK